jgi:hypothetical protein
LSGVKIASTAPLDAPSNRNGPVVTSRAKVCGACGERKPDTIAYFSAYTTSAGNPSRRSTCKVCMSERAKRHHRERPGLRKAAIARRKERLRWAEGLHTNADIDRIKAKLRNTCFYCGFNSPQARDLRRRRLLHLLQRDR